MSSVDSEDGVIEQFDIIEIQTSARFQDLAEVLFLVNMLPVICRERCSLRLGGLYDQFGIDRRRSDFGLLAVVPMDNHSLHRIL